MSQLRVDRTTLWRGLLLATAAVTGALLITIALTPSAMAHSGHVHGSSPTDGRLPGQPDFVKVGKTTYRFNPSREEYEIRRPGEQTAFAHADPLPAEATKGSAEAEAAGIGAGVALPTSTLAPICRTSGNRVVPVYTHRPGEDTETPTSTIRNIVERMNWKINDQSSQSSSGSRAVKMLLDCSAGAINVYNVATSANDLSTIITAVKGQLFGEPEDGNAVKYLIFDADGAGIGGIATIYNDKEKSSDNENASKTAYAIVYAGIWANHVSIHEFFHALGATQGLSPSAAPFSTPGSHCTDGIDVLCYNDATEGASEYAETRCAASSGFETSTGVPLDCGNDTYFDAAPAANSWLDKNWNLGGYENPFLIVPGAPKATTESASSLGQTTANLNGMANSGGYEATYKFEYGTTESYGSSAPSPAAAAGHNVRDEKVSTGVSKLTPNTQYHYRLVTSNSAGTTYGKDMVLKTLPEPPAVVTTPGASEITQSQAMVGGTVNPGGVPVTSCSFSYGKTEAYGKSASCVPGSLGTGSSPVEVEATLNGLEPLTTYHFRIVAKNAGGESVGVDRTFVTAAAPGVTTGTAVPKAVEALLQGTVNPHSLGTSYQFEYGETTAYGTSVPVPAGSAGAGSGNVEVSRTIKGLTEGTTYHFRLTATNAAGTTYGEDQQFKTNQKPVVTTGAVTINGPSAKLNGTVNSNGIITTYQFEYATDAHYEEAKTYDQVSPVVPFAAGEIAVPVAVSRYVNGLESATVYHYRLKATNAAGTTYSEDEEFETPEAGFLFGLYFGSCGEENGELSSPYDLEIGPEGNVFVSDGTTRLQKFNAEGSFLSKVTFAKGFSKFAMDSGGNVYVPRLYSIEKYDPKGKLLLEFGSQGSGNGQFEAANDVTVDDEGNIYVSDAFNNRIQKFNAKGEFLMKFGTKGSGPGQLYIPRHVEVTENGDFIIIDANVRLQWFNAKGEFMHVGDTPPGGSPAAYASVVSDAAGNAFATDYVNPRVLVFDKEGELLDQFGSTGSGEGQFYFPAGIALRNDEEIYVTDYLGCEVSAWRTPPAAPEATAKAASKVSFTGATLNGSVDPESLATTYQFEYGKTTSYGSKVPISPKGVGSSSSDIAVAENLTSLSSGTTYHYRIVATNAKGTTYSSDETVTTEETVVPTATTKAATGVTQNEAQLHADVNPEALLTTYQFEYGETTSYGSKVPVSPEEVGSGTINIAVSETIKKLAASTTYHYRIAATNEAGTAYGEDESFMTEAVSYGPGSWTLEGLYLEEPHVIELDGYLDLVDIGEWGDYVCAVHGEATLEPGDEGEITKFDFDFEECEGSGVLGGCPLLSFERVLPWPIAGVAGEGIDMGTTESNSEFEACLFEFGEMETVSELIATPDDLEAMSTLQVTGSMETVASGWWPLSGEANGYLNVTPPDLYGIADE